ncbi:MAG: 16S rRNA (uracil(1498)-N(3))-methyltransferase [Deltaproteobacteria bacterium]|nr:16S rRNA (uracil(1498)-N(3))-methyltransferase [Deltaproteobacteria bacterium]
MTIQGRIIIEERIESGGDYRLGGAALKNLLLWKPRLAGAVTISDAAGKLFRARVIELDAKAGRLFAFEEAGSESPPFLELTLVQALPEKERMELIIQKTTELGVSRIIPFKSLRSISLDERERGQKKSHKWQDIALKASKQSRRPSIAEVLPYTSFNDAINNINDAQIKIMLSEQKGIAHLKDFLSGKGAEPFQSDAKSIAVLSGPEGGFSNEEVNAAIKQGFNPVSLGSRILRAETASILAVGLIQYELGG